MRGRSVDRHVACHAPFGSSLIAPGARRQRQAPVPARPPGIRHGRWPPRLTPAQAGAGGCSWPPDTPDDGAAADAAVGAGRAPVKQGVWNQGMPEGGRQGEGLQGIALAIYASWGVHRWARQRVCVVAAVREGAAAGAAAGGGGSDEAVLVYECMCALKQDCRCHAPAAFHAWMDAALGCPLCMDGPFSSKSNCLSLADLAGGGSFTLHTSHDAQCSGNANGRLRLRLLHCAAAGCRMGHHIHFATPFNQLLLIGEGRIDSLALIGITGVTAARQAVVCGCSNAIDLSMRHHLSAVTDCIIACTRKRQEYYKRAAAMHGCTIIFRCTACTAAGNIDNHQVEASFTTGHWPSDLVRAPGIPFMFSPQQSQARGAA